MNMPKIWIKITLFEGYYVQYIYKPSTTVIYTRDSFFVVEECNKIKTRFFYYINNSTDE
jgi:hypothetical protein